MKTKTEFEKILAMAETGSDSIDGKTLWELGYIFDEGLFENEIMVVNPDPQKAFYWYKQGMYKGDENATVRVADFLSDGRGCKQDIEKAISIYQTCIEKGSSIAAKNLGITYRDLKDYEQAFKYYTLEEELMSKSYEKTVYTLEVALCYLHGIGVEKDIPKAVERLIRLTDDDNDYTCEWDIEEAYFILGTLYLYGIGVERDIEEARIYLSVADEDHDHRSAHQLLLVIGKEELE